MWWMATLGAKKVWPFKARDTKMRSISAPFNMLKNQLKSFEDVSMSSEPQLRHESSSGWKGFNNIISYI